MFNLSIHLLLVSILIIYLLVNQQIENRTLNIIMLSLIFSVISHIKFNYLLIIIFLMVIYCIFSVKNRKYNEIILLIISYFSFFLIVWLTSGQKITYLINYLYFGLNVSKYYSSSMNIDINYLNFRILFFTMLFLILFILYNILLFFLSKNRKPILFLFLSLPYIFILYKWMITRCDLAHIFHASYCLFIWIFLSSLVINYDVQYQKTPKLMVLNMMILTVFALLFFSLLVIKNNFIAKTFSDCFNNFPVLSLSCKEKALNAYNFRRKLLQESINDYFKLYPETISAIGNNTVDIFPTELILAYGYNLNLKLRPVIQSYADYSSELDKYNSEMFVLNKPDYLLFTLHSVDSRYPLFDEPSTFYAVLSSYKFSSMANDNYLLLKRKINNPLNKNCFSYITCKFNEFVAVPKSENSLIFSSIKLRKNLVSKIRSLFWKDNTVWIQFLLNDNSLTEIYRFNYSNSQNGCLISEYIQNINDLKNLFSGIFTNNVSAFRLIDNSEDFINEYNVKFWSDSVKPIKIFNDNLNLKNINNLSGIEKSKAEIIFNDFSEKKITGKMRLHDSSILKTDIYLIIKNINNSDIYKFRLLNTKYIEGKQDINNNGFILPHFDFTFNPYRYGILNGKYNVGFLFENNIKKSLVWTNKILEIKYYKDPYN